MSGIVFGCVTPHPPLLLPDIGGGREEDISSTSRAMKELAQALPSLKPDLALIISPHGQWQYDAMGIFTGPVIRGHMRNWGSRIPEISLSNDTDFAKTVMQEGQKSGIPVKSLGDETYDLDHGVMVPFHFLLPSLKGIPVILLTFSALSLSLHLSFGRVLQKVALDSKKRAVLIASGDLSHRLIPSAPAGYDPKGKEFDELMVKSLSEMDTRALLSMKEEFIDRAGECGLRSIVILLGALEGQKVTPKILSYEGPFGVGYLVASFNVEAEKND